MVKMDEKADITEKVDDAANAQEEVRRKAWRNLLIPAVGSAAFFTATFLNVLRTHQQYGWPGNAFTVTDYALMSIPFVIIVLGIAEEANGSTAGA